MNMFTLHLDQVQMNLISQALHKLPSALPKLTHEEEAQINELREIIDSQRPNIT